MQQSLSSGAGSASPSTSGEAQGLHKDPDQVIWQFMVPGWAVPVGTVYDLSRGEEEELVVQDTSLRFQPFYFSRMEITPPCHLMIMQGLKVSQLFSGLLHKVGGGDALPGPWVFLKGDLSAPWDPPVLRDVTIARISIPIEKKFAGELLKLLVDRVLNRS